MAEEVGFNQAAYFTSCFSKYEGLSPREYRQLFSHG
ncbi:AraC family transcriptional regulator [Paenibacillus baekrokdamisoli]